MSAPASPSTPPVTPGTPVSVPPPPRRRGLVVAVVVVVVVIVAGALLVGFEDHWFAPNSKSGTCGTDVTLLGNGAQFVNPLVQQWATAYQSNTSNIVNYVDGGSGTGITDFSENPPLIDFAITDDPLSSSETSALPSAALTIPVVGGALAIIYNLPGVAGHLNLTGPLLAEIYFGTITNWDNASIAAINPGVSLPNATIVTVHRSDAAGTTFVLTNLLTDDSSAWASGPGQGISISWPKAPTQLAEKGNSAVLDTVQTTADAIGYSDLTDVLTAKVSTQYAAIENPKGNFIIPDLANTASAIADESAVTTFPASGGSWSNISMVNAPGASDYPLATFAYLFVYENSAKGYDPSQARAQVLVQWLDWLLTSGQTYASGPNLYYVALPSSLITIDKAGVASMNFNGAAIPACS